MHCCLDVRKTGPQLENFIYWADGFHHSSTLAFAERQLSKGEPFVPLQFDGTHLWIGPLGRQGLACVACFRSRYQAAMDPFLKGNESLQVAIRENSGRAWLLPEQKILGELLAKELVGYEHTSHMSFLYKLNLEKYKIELIRLYRDFTCELCCSQHPEEKVSPQAGAILDEPELMANQYRLKPLRAASFYQETYIQEDIGLVVRCAPELDTPCIAPGISTMFAGSGFKVNAGGHEFSFEKSLKVSTIEALERYMGLAPRKKIEIVHASYRDVAAQALDPRKVGLPSEYHEPLEPYDPDRIYPWVWGFSLRKRAPILIPYQLVYYDQELIPGPKFVHDNSNGCAVGSSLREALYYGLLELIERDHFLLSWFGSCPLKPFHIRDLDHFETQVLVDRINQDGVDVHFFAMKFDMPVYAVMAIAERRDATFGRLVFAAGCHTQLEKAVHAALVEVASYYPVMAKSPPENTAALDAMYANFEKVTKLKDHQMLWCMPEMRQHASFLLDQTQHGPIASATDIYPQDQSSTEGDFNRDLKQIMHALEGQGYEVICVDESPEELKDSDLKGLRVIVPGLVPMTFGFRYRRLDGLDRLEKLPQKMGYRDVPVDFHNVNPVPHPFP